MNKKVKQLNAAIHILLQFCLWGIFALIVLNMYQSKKNTPSIIPECRELLKNNYCTDTCQCEKFQKAFLFPQQHIRFEDCFRKSGKIFLAAFLVFYDFFCKYPIHE